jgi:hypothetical protein
MKGVIKESEGWGTRKKIARHLKIRDEIKNYVTSKSGVLLEHPILI